MRTILILAMFAASLADAAVSAYEEDRALTLETAGADTLKIKAGAGHLDIEDGTGSIDIEKVQRDPEPGAIFAGK